MNLSRIFRIWHIRIIHASRKRIPHIWLLLLYRSHIASSCFHEVQTISSSTIIVEQGVSKLLSSYSHIGIVVEPLIINTIIITWLLVIQSFTLFPLVFDNLKGSESSKELPAINLVFLLCPSSVSRSD
jgi:hypothetical protein